MKLAIIAILALLAAAIALPGPAHSKMVAKWTVDEASRDKGEIAQQGGAFETYKGFRGWKSLSNAGAGEHRNKVFAPAILAAMPKDNGSLVIWAYLDNSVRGHEEPIARVFSLVDGKGRDLFAIGLMPNYFGLDYDGREAPVSGLSRGGHMDNDVQRKIYGSTFPLPYKLKPNQWFNIVMTWGPDPSRDNRLFVNGTEVAYQEDYVRPAARTARFSTVLASARNFLVGSDGDGFSTYNVGVVGEVQVHDEILTAVNLPRRGAPSIRSFGDDSFKVPGISGKLVAGDKVTFTMEAEPGAKATVDVGGVTGIPLAEDKAAPGKYSGVFAVPPGLYLDKVKPVGRLADESGSETDNVIGGNAISIDSLSRFALTIDRNDLPADSAATARVKVKVADANGNPVRGHQVKVTLSTTDEYTGLVGGGSARYRNAAAAAKELLAGAEVETRWKGETDAWGEVEFDFRAGFAAKTVILQAKDMTSGDVGVDYITSFKEASIDIALTQPVSRAAARRGGQYILKVEATRTELTADGRSRSVIRATLSDPNGAPVPGDPVTFALSSPNGSLRAIQGATDSAGVATAEYTAGKKIGIVVVTATATLRNASGNVSIILLADAPAKIYLKARPESLPADGVSRADLSVKVTDINDNPNKDTKVEFRVAKGGGKLEYPDRVTDRFGDTANRYTAGTAPGIATVAATVRSKVPSDAELAKARNVIFVPYSPDGDEIKITRWLKRVGETALKGEPVVEYTVGRNPEPRVLKAPYDCRIDFQHVEYWDTARTGDTLAQISPAAIPGSTNAPPAPANLAPRRR